MEKTEIDGESASNTGPMVKNMAVSCMARIRPLVAVQPDVVAPPLMTNLVPEVRQIEAVVHAKRVGEHEPFERRPRESKVRT